jgi:hypothetical protein
MNRIDRQALPQLAATSAVFAAAYAGCNRLTSLRADVGAAMFDFERHMPFVPWTIVPYLSIVFFFVFSFFAGGGRAAQREHVLRLLLNLGVAIACYLLVPLRFQFERPAVDGAAGWLFTLLAACDLPYNRAPSLHISVLLLLWLRLAPGLAGWRRLALQLWFTAIGLSVLTTWQHHLVDIPAGLAAGAFSVWLVRILGRRAMLRAVRSSGPLPESAAWTNTTSRRDSAPFHPATENDDEPRLRKLRHADRKRPVLPLLP